MSEVEVKQKPEEILSSIQKQHEITWNRSLLGSNLAPNGPWQRTQLPLLKTNQRFREFFVRIDCHSVVRYSLNEFRERVSETLFYPSFEWIRNYEARKDTEAKNVYEKLYEKLKENGLGQTYLNVGKSKRILNKKKPKRIQLKRKSIGRIKLKRG